MAIYITAKNRYLAGNGVNFSVSSTGGKTITYIVYETSGSYLIQLYQGIVVVFSDAVVVDITSVFNEYVNNAMANSFQIYVRSNTNESTSKNFMVYGCGISKALFRKLEKKGTNFFDFRIKNADTNFFLTTRTSSNLIVIPENELLPLAFYGQYMFFHIVANNINIYNYGNYLEYDSVNHVDLETLRLDCSNHTKGFIPSIFNVLNDWQELACVIVITEAPPTDHYIIFKNSLGVDEKIALYGVISFIPELSEPEDILEYDSVINDFVPVPERKEATIKYTAETSYCDDKRFLFLMDMLLSQECRFVSFGIEYEAKVSADSPLLSSTNGTPVKLKLNIELLDKEDKFSMPDEDIILLEYEYLTTNNDDVITNNNGTSITLN